MKFFFNLRLKISITTELIGFSISSKLYLGPVKVLDYLIFAFSVPLNMEPLDARGAAASIIFFQ